MDWNDTVTLLILADTILNAKLLVGGYFLWRWWGRRGVRIEADVEHAIIGQQSKEA